LPFYLYFTEDSFESSKSFLHFYKEIIKYILELSESNNDIYFVTYNQLINWMKNPITTDAINLMNKSEYEITEQKPKKELSCKSPNKCKYSSTVIINNK